jgi:hypothetical protein
LLWGLTKIIFVKHLICSKNSVDSHWR